MIRPLSTTGPEATERAGADLAAQLGPGDVVLVSGELGAGKTTFVRGALRALGVTGTVTSPTFVVGHAYDGAHGPGLAPRPLPAGRDGRRGSRACSTPSSRPTAIAFVEWPEHAPGRVAGGARRAPRAARPRRRRRAPDRGHVILGIDTATPATAVAVWAPDGPAVERRDDPAPGERPGHAARLLALVDEVVTGLGRDHAHRGRRRAGRLHRAADRHRHRPRARAGARPAAGRRLEPGGARPRRTTARSWPSSTPAAARCSPPRRARFEPVALAPEALAARIEPGSLAVGDGAVRFREELERAGATVPADDSPLHRVSALEVCRLGAAGEPADRDALLPDYRREPDAKPRQPAVTAPPAAAVEIRSLTYADLPQVVAIERRAFTTPWSLAMFVLELSKPSGICLAAEADGELVGYLICSRYDTIWHIMNVAVDPDRRRRGIASALIGALLDRVGPDGAAHARGAPLQRRRDRPLRALLVPLGRRPAPLLRRQRRGRRDHVAHAGHAARDAGRRPRP